MEENLLMTSTCFSVLITRKHGGCEFGVLKNKFEVININ